MKRVIGVVAAMVVGMVGGSGASADASGTPTLVVNKWRSVPAARDVIVCDAVEGLKISNPHKSHHEPRNINVIATITCAKAVTSITLAVRLYRNGKKVKAKTFTKFGKSYLKGNASVGCKGTSGRYQGKADVRVVFPPGYTPSTKSAHLKSKVIKVNCWK